MSKNSTSRGTPRTTRPIWAFLAGLFLALAPLTAFADENFPSGNATGTEISPFRITSAAVEFNQWKHR